MTAMTTTSITVAEWNKRIAEQLGWLRQARTERDRCPSAENAKIVEAREERLDFLFGQRARAQIQAQPDDLAGGAPVIPEREVEA